MKNLLPFLCLFFGIRSFAQVTFTGSGTSTSVANNAPAILVDTALAITTSLTIPGAGVSISANFISGDVLGFNSGSLPSGVTGSYNSVSGVLSFTGNATAAQYQVLLRTVTFNTTATSTLQRTILFNLGSVVAYSGTNHFYQFIAGSFTWTTAKANAAASTLFGLQGYLTTITSQGENDFIQQKITGDGWIGASDDYSQINIATGTTTYANQTASEGNWYWVTGPASEIGTKFSTSDNTPVAYSGRFMNWTSGEPNNTGGTENSGEIYNSTGTGKWNDLTGGSNSLGYVVEYGGMTGDPTVTLSCSRNIVMIATQLQTTVAAASYGLTSPAVFVDQNVLIYSTTSITNMNVTISGSFQTGDVLSYTGSLPSGVTASYNSTTGVLSFTGSTTPANWQALVRTVKFNTTSSVTGTRTITFSAGNLASFTNGHFYEYVGTTSTWAVAKTSAAARTYLGLTGYLATITSLAENNFILQKLSTDAWIGASDDYNYINAATGATTYASQTTSEGNWYWVTGPVGEIGTQFSASNNSPTSVSGRFMNWNAGEPNNSGGSENYAEFYASNGTGQWNDLSGTGPLGYVTEYGGLATDPLVYLSANRSMSVNSLLPVSGLNFTVTKKGSTAQLNWSTEAEINSDHFDVQWSTDAVHFSTLATIHAADNSSIKQYYSFTHQNPVTGDNFYRLQQVDADGNSTLSATRYFHIDGSVLALSPNPASSLIVINSEVSTEPKELQIVDVSGKIILKTKLTVQRQSISIASLPKGIYIAEILADKVGIKFIKN